MIRVDINETFPVTVSVVDEDLGVVASGKTVYYDIRHQPDDITIASGVLLESAVAPGFYNKLMTIDAAGEYILYATCSGFISSTEQIIVNGENLYHLTKQNRPYNTSVEEVLRTTIDAARTPSQIARNVPLNKTDYILNTIKLDTDSDWATTTISGIVYAHYRSVTESAPYRMGGDGL